MLSWLKRRPRRQEPTQTIAPKAETTAIPQGHGMSKAFLALHDYLKNRYADVVVLTFGQMEDLLGSPLPVAATKDLAWWNGDVADNFEHSNSWRLANRTAVANLMARTATFERA
jgi:hypothetical protein